MLAIPSFLLFACASAPEHGVEYVRVVTVEQREKQCTSLGNFTVEQRGGPDKPGSALTKARNEVLRRGGNAILVIASNVDWEDGATVNADALQCKF